MGRGCAFVPWYPPLRFECSTEPCRSPGTGPCCRALDTYSEAYWMALWRVLGEILGAQSRSKALVNSTSIKFSSIFPSFTSVRVLRSTASIASTCSGCLTRCLSASWIMQSKIASFTLLFLTVVIYPILIGARRRFAARFLNVIYGEALGGLRQRISGQRCDGVGRGWDAGVQMRGT